MGCIPSFPTTVEAAHAPTAPSASLSAAKSECVKAPEEALPVATSNSVVVVHSPPITPRPAVLPAPVSSTVPGPHVLAEALPTPVPASTVDDDPAAPAAVPAALADAQDVNVVADSATAPVAVVEVAASSVLAAPQPQAGTEAVLRGSASSEAGAAGVLSQLAVEVRPADVSSLSSDVSADDPRAQKGVVELHSAAADGDVAAVKSLLQRQNVDVNATTEKAWTALHFAAYYNHADVIGVLLADTRLDFSKTKGAHDLAKRHDDRVAAKKLAANPRVPVGKAGKTASHGTTY